MATIVAYNAAKMLEIEDNTTIDGNVDGSGDLILERRNGTTFNAGSVGAPTGDQGPERPLAPGQISLYGGAVAPQGWAFCDGAPVSRVNFPDLFAVIGTQYGAGDGTTTFNLPNLKGRVAVGLDAAQTEFDTLAKQGGAKTHVLTTAELPAHTHTVLAYKGKDDSNFTGNTGRLQGSDGSTPFDQPTASVGGAGAHNNLQPYFTINYIMSLGIAGFDGGGVAKNRYFTATTRGTTSQRDTKYGVPATLAERVALANQQVTWYNTDLGWKERYYEVTAASGLTAIGLVTGATPGWYPISEGPYIELIALAEVAQFYNTFITGWSIYNRKGGASWFTLTGTDRIDVLKHGRYDVEAYTTQYSLGTSLIPDYSLQVLGTDDVTVIKGIGGGALQRIPNYNTRAHQEGQDMIILPNQKVRWKLQRGTMPGGDTTMQVHGGGSDVDRGRLTVKYVGPPLNDL